jgi:hypothetical protein
VVADSGVVRREQGDLQLDRRPSARRVSAIPQCVFEYFFFIVFIWLLGRCRRIPSLADQKKKILANLVALEPSGLCTSANKYQDLLTAIAQDIRNQRIHRRQRKQQIARLVDALKDLDHKSKYFSEQAESYDVYVASCLSELAKGGKKCGGAAASVRLWFNSFFVVVLRQEIAVFGFLCAQQVAPGRARARVWLVQVQRKQADGKGRCCGGGGCISGPVRAACSLPFWVSRHLHVHPGSRK